MDKPVPVYQVDAFSSRAYGGNPAAVCLLNERADTGWMQAVGAEMNLSETAFLWSEGATYRLRWFSPLREVDLCGHATLASAHVLWESGVVEGSAAVRFQTRSGELVASRVGDWIELDFPATPAVATKPPPGLIAALGVEPVFVGKSEQQDYLVEVESEAQVRSLDPDFRRLATVKARGTIVTARAGSEEHHFVSRFFVPRYGIDEDPVTGSAHCALAPYWSPKLGIEDLVGYQASTRGGIVRARLLGDRVILSGQAVTVLRGELLR
ncbi:MAG: PhzF family phenazine biosynthesis protein [Gemmatimonadota bacterium]|jgi:PhzF family phenazine biosynthesis protein